MLNPYYTAEDLLREVNFGLTYNDVQVVPRFCDVKSRSNISTSTKLVGNIFIDHPLIPANMDTISGLDMAKECSRQGSVCFFHRFNGIEEIENNIRDFVEDPISKILGVSVGISAKDLNIIRRAWVINEDKLPLVALIDVAHGDHFLVHDQIKRIKDDFPDIPIIAGNIATGEAAERLVLAGADGVKVGVGPGSLCSTRIETGAGVPQFTAIADVAHTIKYNHDVTIIADGGVKYAGDIVKAIGAGANSVMSGYLFAGTNATPGRTIIDPIHGTFKEYRGSASRESKVDRGEHNHIEGVSTRVKYRGETSEVFISTSDGIRSGLSYAGFGSLTTAVGKMTFVRISQSSITEAQPNGAK